MSTVDPIKDEVRGATNHSFFLNRSKIWISNNWAVIKATPDPIAILTEIKSAKSVENNNVNIIPIKNPKYTICLANNFPYDLFAKSVIKKAIG